MGGVDDLAAWLREQIDEDERVALAAPRYNWTIYLAGDSETDERTEQRVLDHVIRHAPDRVLRDVEAKRRIAAECLRTLECEDYGYSLAEDVLKLLALPYADRPGYRQEWAP